MNKNMSKLTKPLHHYFIPRLGMGELAFFYHPSKEIEYYRLKTKKRSEYDAYHPLYEVEPPEDLII